MAGREDPVVLSFHDSCLRQSDVNLLDGTHWLNDKLIGFAFEYYEKTDFSQHAAHVAYISPDVTQFIKLAQAEEVGFFLEPLRLETKKYVFLAVNDNADNESVGGNHWSLLVYRREKGQLEHYDSYGSNNAFAARDIALKIEPYLKSSSKVKFVESTTPQQINCSDCGVYVVCIARQLSRQIFSENEPSLSEVITPQFVTQTRIDLKKLILSLAQDNG